jgi:hypothetical protein
VGTGGSVRLARHHGWREVVLSIGYVALIWRSID